ncbi:AAA family ATPase [Catellatospora bangladeshensis]|uniref:AAA family ATPase n=1 Tax=Catellatospora bangladeshensis TaxID=310355 RepID=UPI00361D7228
MNEPTEPVEGLRPPGEPFRQQERPTRKRLPFWDRVKFLFLFAVAWLVLVWATIADFPGGMPFSEAALIQLTEARWLLILAGVELLRQLHFLVSEHWSAYHRFWTHRVFGGFERVTHRRLSDWSRFRLARMLKWLFWIGVFALVAGTVLDTSPVLALFQAPAILWALLPYALQLIFILAVVVLQFVAIFWFLSRGGVDVYYPDDIKTRFADVWGQDHVLARVRENIVFLERPEEIEAKGGYVPSGLLLWGPPGTGKTLMAEAVAGRPASRTCSSTRARSPTCSWASAS